MPIISHLQILITLCTAILGPLVFFDKIIEDATKKNITSWLIRKKPKAPKFLELIPKILNDALLTHRRKVKLGKVKIMLVFPSLRRFIVAHTAIVTVVAIFILLQEEPLIHEAHHQSEVSGIVFAGYQLHTMLLREWISIVIAIGLVSAPFDYLSAVKTLSFYELQWAKGIIIGRLVFILDLILTLMIGAFSVFLFYIFATAMSQPLPEFLFGLIGGISPWRPSSLITPGVITIGLGVFVTGLIFILSALIGLSVTAFQLIKVIRRLKFCVLKRMKFREFPLSVAGGLLCVFVVTMYAFASAII